MIVNMLFIADTEADSLLTITAKNKSFDVFNDEHIDGCTMMVSCLVL